MQQLDVPLQDISLVGGLAQTGWRVHGSGRRRHSAVLSPFLVLVEHLQDQGNLLHCVVKVGLGLYRFKCYNPLLENGS